MSSQKTISFPDVQTNEEMENVRDYYKYMAQAMQANMKYMMQVEKRDENTPEDLNDIKQKKADIQKDFNQYSAQFKIVNQVIQDEQAKQKQNQPQSQLSDVSQSSMFDMKFEEPYKQPIPKLQTTLPSQIKKQSKFSM